MKVELGYYANRHSKLDAIHVAVMPVICGQEELRPGDHVTVINSFAVKTTIPKGQPGGPLGIIDPFFELDIIHPNCRVWLLMYPDTVIQLGHVWSHPAFQDKKESEKWLREYAVMHNPYDVEDPYTRTEIDNGEERAFQRLIKGLTSLELFFHGTDLHGLHELDRADELQLHAETYLGCRIHWNNFNFGCSC